MNDMPLKLRRELAADDRYRVCTRYMLLHDHICESDPVTGRSIEWEHAFIYAGKQIQEPWAIVSLCWLTHRGPLANKPLSQLIALSRATKEDLMKYPNVDWVKEIRRLNFIVEQQKQNSLAPCLA